MAHKAEEFSRDVTVEVEFEQGVLDAVDRFATAHKMDRRSALHNLVLYGFSVEVGAQEEHPTWAWHFPDVDPGDAAAARAAVEAKGHLVARWRADPEFGGAEVAVWQLRRIWACTVTDAPGAGSWQVQLTGTFEAAAWSGGAAIGPISRVLAPSAMGPIWVLAEGERVEETGWAGYLDPDVLGEEVTIPPRSRDGGSCTDIPRALNQDS